MQRFRVEGMSCAHCERAVTEAVHSVDPQAAIQVDLSAGIVTADSTAEPAALVRAIEAEGYKATQA